MGEAKQRQLSNQRFLEKHPLCCLCGGDVKATTIEHAPPKVLFIDKQLPASSHRVPACKRCNNGSGDQDQIAALYTIISASMQSDIPMGYFDKLASGVRENSPEAFRAMSGGTRRSPPSLLRVNGLLREVNKLSVNPNLFRTWLDPWAAKQAYALHYLHACEIVPSTAQVFVRWFSNENIMMGRIPNDLIQILPNFGELRQGRKSSVRQFSYKWLVAGERGIYMLYLHQASIALVSVLRNAQSAIRFNRKRLFMTNAERGIHVVPEKLIGRI